MAQDEPRELGGTGVQPGRRPPGSQAVPLPTVTDSRRPSQGRASQRGTRGETTDGRGTLPDPHGSGRRPWWRLLLRSPTVARILEVLAVLIALLALILDVLDSTTVDQWGGKPPARTTEATPATSPSPSGPAPTGPTATRGSSQPSQTEFVDDGTLLANGGTDVNRHFRASSPWHLVAIGMASQPCELSILDGTDKQIQWAKGEVFQVHKRQSGRFKLHQAHHCRVEFHQGAGSPQRLPLTVTSTAGGGATPVFLSTAGFLVTTSASANCRAVVFRSSDGTSVRKVSAGVPARVSTAGEFWIEIEQRNCLLSIRST
jgi:hypothetical protein